MTEQTKKETADLEEALSQDVVSEEEIEEVVDVVEEGEKPSEDKTDPPNVGQSEK